MKKLKVAYICTVSNQLLYNHLSFENSAIKNFIRFLFKKKKEVFAERAPWNTILFESFTQINDIELHPIVLIKDLKTKRQDFTIDGIHYHFIQAQKISLDFLFNPSNNILQHFRRNRKLIKSVIEEISPDVINLVGAELTQMSISGLDLDENKYPLFLSMQTALSDPDFLKNYPMEESWYQKASTVEQALFKKFQYIGSDSEWYRSIAKLYNPNAQMLRFHFCSKLDIDYLNLNVEKEFDFVYYATNLNKAGADALQAFAQAYKKNNTLTLNLIGDYSQEFKSYLLDIIDNNSINRNNVIFSGFFTHHKDALQQVLKSKFALVPIKIDIISGTIREAMLLGLPTVSFITKGTPAINRKKECILLSPIGDYVGMGENMLKLVNNPQYAEELKKNALEYAQAIGDTKKNIRILADTYHAIYENFHTGKEFPNYVKESIY